MFYLKNESHKDQVLVWDDEKPESISGDDVLIFCLDPEWTVK